MMLAIIGKPCGPVPTFPDQPYTKGHRDCFDLLLGMADLSKKTKDGITAFKFACRKGRDTAVERVLPVSDIYELDKRGSDTLTLTKRNNISEEHERIVWMIEMHRTAARERAEIQRSIGDIHSRKQAIRM